MDVVYLYCGIVLAAIGSCIDIARSDKILSAQMLPARLFYPSNNYSEEMLFPLSFKLLRRPHYILWVNYSESE